VAVAHVQGVAQRRRRLGENSEVSNTRLPPGRPLHRRMAVIFHVSDALASELPGAFEAFVDFLKREKVDGVGSLTLKGIVWRGGDVLDLRHRGLPQQGYIRQDRKCSWAVMHDGRVVAKDPI
jgi:hypothetical protein